jgi:alkanesulfonate monooxygenase SsuD/methylene tetrahydromethanopterin reductase-like flavin-dependent oxidoreductase (luciferase family)
MRYGMTTLWADDVEDFRQRIRRAEALGFDQVGVGDSPTVYRELWVSMAMAASVTDRLRLASWTTVPTGRHPLLTACAVSTLQELSHDRVVVGIGTGASASAALGKRASSRAGLQSFVEALRTLLDGGSVAWAGTSVPPLTNPRPAPIYLAAYGPQARVLAGELGDGVILSSGPASPLLPGDVEEVRTAARRVGRDPDELDIWITSRFSLQRGDRPGPDLRGTLSGTCFGLASAAQRRTVPPELQPKLDDLQARYDPTQHEVVGGTNARLIDELGLTDYLTRRFALVGTLEECRAQLRAVEELGVRGVEISIITGDPEQTMQDFAEVIGGATPSGA